MPTLLPSERAQAAGQRALAVLARVMRASTAAVATVAIGGCSSFNMAPACDQSALGLQQVMATRQAGGKIDRLRVSAIVQVDDLTEIGSGYNERSCSARVTVNARQLMVRYRVRQSEGLHDWYDISFLDPNDPALQEMVAAAQAAYASQL